MCSLRIDVRVRKSNESWGNGKWPTKREDIEIKFDKTRHLLKILKKIIKYPTSY